MFFRSSDAPEFETSQHHDYFGWGVSNSGATDDRKNTKTIEDFKAKSRIVVTLMTLSSADKQNNIIIMML